MTLDDNGDIGAIAEEAELVCREVVELMTAYLENALDAEARAEFQAHLDVCDDCARYLEQMRQTVDFLRGLGPNGPTPETTRELLARFRSWRSPPR